MLAINFDFNFKKETSCRFSSVLGNRTISDLEIIVLSTFRSLKTVRDSNFESCELDVFRSKGTKLQRDSGAQKWPIGLKPPIYLVKRAKILSQRPERSAVENLLEIPKERQ